MVRFLIGIDSSVWGFRVGSFKCLGLWALELCMCFWFFCGRGGFEPKPWHRTEALNQRKNPEASNP